MKLSQLALTLVLVAGGIFVYDALIVREAVEMPAEELRVEAPLVRPAEDLPSFAVLEGRGDEIWRSDIERRLEQLEVPSASAGRTVAEGDGSTPTVPGTQPQDGEEVDAPLGEDGKPRPRRFTPQDVATFRALLETVERQRREEKTRNQMLDGLKKIGVQLNDVESNAVVDLTLRLYRSVQAKSRDLPKGEEGRPQRVAVFNELMTDYSDELYGIIPSAEADRIVDALNRRANVQPKGGR